MLALVLENDGSSPTAGLLILFFFNLFYFLFLYFYYILFISLFFIHYYFFYYFTWNGPKMFVDLDWPTNASSPLSASAELLVLFSDCSAISFYHFCPQCWWLQIEIATTGQNATCSFLNQYLVGLQFVSSIMVVLCICILFLHHFLNFIFSFFRAAVSPFKTFCPAHIVLRNINIYSLYCTFWAINDWLIDWLID